MFLFIILFAAVLVCLYFAIRIFILDKLFVEASNKAILVTGSSAGFGRQFVLKCLDEGVTVFAACRTIEGVESMKKDCASRKGVVDLFVMDICSDTDVKIALAHVEEELKKSGKTFHALVNNAGIQCECFFDDFLTLQDYHEALRVNTLGPISVMHAFKPLIKSSKSRIVTCTSSCVRFPSPGLGPYITSKWALSGYMEMLRHELYDFGVTVVTIQPGIFCTALNEVAKMMKMMNKRWAISNQNLKNEYGEYWFSAGKHAYIKLREGAPKNLDTVTNSYYHAVMAKYPYKNYVVGLDAKFVYQPFSWLPARFQEIVMKLLEKTMGAPTPSILD